MKAYKGKNGKWTFYVGNVKKTQNGGSLFSQCFEDIPKNAWKLHKNGKHYLSGFINNAKDQKYGNTHDMVLQMDDKDVDEKIKATNANASAKSKYDDAKPIAPVKTEASPF